MFYFFFCLPSQSPKKLINKNLNLDINTKFIKYSLKNILVKTMFSVNDFKILLFKARLVLWPADQITGTQKVKISLKNQKEMFEFSWNYLKYDFLRSLGGVSCFSCFHDFVSIFQSRKNKKHKLKDSHSFATFEHRNITNKSTTSAKFINSDVMRKPIK